MQADFEVIANERNITALLRDRLLGIRITDKPGLESDECEIRIDDRGGKVAFPPKGATLKVSLGWPDTGLAYLGTYRVDEIELTGPPATVVIRGKPADMRQAAKSQRSAGYENTTLAAIVEAVAKRHGWQPVCQVEATVPRADQVGESDMHFITRLARSYGATAAVKAGKLLVLPRGGGKSAGGNSLPVVVLTPDMLETYSITFPDRSGYGGVKAKAHDSKTGKQIDIAIPNPEPPPDGGAIHTDRHVYPNPAAAKAAAESRLGALNRSTATGSLSLIGRADFAAEKEITLRGFKPEADGNYLVESVTHTYSGKSWTMSVEINAGNAGKAKAGHGKKAGGATQLVIPDTPK
jgi:uncharacterized protein